MMPLTPIDAIKIAAVCSTLITAALMWVHCSSQTKVPRDLRTSRKIAQRIFGVYTAFFLMFGGTLEVSVNILLLAILFISLMTAAVSFDTSFGGTDTASFAFVLAATTPFYVLQQFVLGFPDRDLVILVPPKVDVNLTPPPRKSDIGVVMATLRPMGRIDLAGECFSAAAADGKMLDVGTHIRVCGQRGTVLLVEAMKDQLSDSESDCE